MLAGNHAADETLPEGAELVTPLLLLLLLVSGMLVVAAAEEEEGAMEGGAADDKGRRPTTADLNSENRPKAVFDFGCEASSAV